MNVSPSGSSAQTQAPRAEGVINDVAALERLYDRPLGVVRRKQLRRLDRHCRRFIELSPLAFLSTAARDGTCDVSPRGDPPGFTLILDDSKLALPDRKGNNRLESLRNVLENPHVGLLFVIPGIEDVLRVNGEASVISEPALLSRLTAGGRPALAALLINIHEVYLHCGRAFKRASVWDPERFVSREALPPLSEMLAEQSRASAEERRILVEGETAELY